MKFRVVVAVFLIQVANVAQAQQTDPDISIDSVFLFMKDTARFFDARSKVDPLKAALYSAILPGLGQAYNGQHWKIPIIYGGGIAFVHLIRQNHRLYNQFRAAKIALSENAPVDATNPFEAYAPGIYNTNAINRNLEKYRRDRDYLMILASVYYLLNIAEAHIAAHLKEFDINDELSFQIKPSFESSPLFSRSTGLSLTFKF